MLANRLINVQLGNHAWKSCLLSAYVMKFDLFVQKSFSRVEEFKLEIRNPKSETISNDKNSKQKN
jgi:hypothetical protein